jgi:hypothetical protein
MRRLAICLTLGASLMWAAPAEANGWNNFRAGLQGILQFPADPVIHVWSPPEEFIEELPAGQFTGRILGLFSGTALGVYRAAMGVADVALSPLWIFPTMSPEARRNWFGVEYEDI